MKNVLGGIFGHKSTAQKRCLEGGETEESRKKRLVVAVNEVEAALQRLRQVTRSPTIDDGEQLECKIEDEDDDTRAVRDSLVMKRLRESEIFEVADSCASETVGKSPELGMECEMDHSENTDLEPEDSFGERDSLEASSQKSWEATDVYDSDDFSSKCSISSDDEDDKFSFHQSCECRSASFNSDFYNGTPKIKIEALAPPSANNTTPETSFTTSVATPITTNTTAATSPTAVISPSPPPAYQQRKIRNLINPSSLSPSPARPGWNKWAHVPRELTPLNFTPDARKSTPSSPEPSRTPAPRIGEFTPQMRSPEAYPSKSPFSSLEKPPCPISRQRQEFTPYLKTPRIDPSKSRRRSPQASPSPAPRLVNPTRTDSNRFTPIKTESVTPPTDLISSPAYSFVAPPPRPYPIERFPQFITPRSPARQERLKLALNGLLQKERGNARRSMDSMESVESVESVKLVKSVESRGLRWSCRSVESKEGFRGSDEDINLPVLMATSTECEKVWDAEIIVGDTDRWGKITLARVK